MKKVLMIQRSDIPHWVGDGFPVRTIFHYIDSGNTMTPFLLMDYGGPSVFPPTEHKKGVGEHPHRGFETVTIVYAGEVEHRDSSGGGGLIKPGDVQWMTAASGLVHEEFHGKEFAKKGGEFEMIQLWVNLPQKYKMHKPKYQGIKKENIPYVSLKNNEGYIRVIAGDYQGHKGPANTFSPINLWDMSFSIGSHIHFKVPKGHTASLFVLHGDLEFSDGSVAKDAELVILERGNEDISFKVQKNSKVLFMGGEPILEPIVGYGPFVMNTRAEIAQAFKDYEAGKMGVLERLDGAE